MNLYNSYASKEFSVPKLRDLILLINNRSSESAKFAS